MHMKLFKKKSKPEYENIHIKGFQKGYEETFKETFPRGKWNFQIIQFPQGHEITEIHIWTE